MQALPQLPVLDNNIQNCRAAIQTWIDTNIVTDHFDGQPQVYLPWTLLAALVSEKTVAHLLAVDPTINGYPALTKDEFKNNVCLRGKRMFCMAMYNNVSMHQLFNIMHHVDDNDCPSRASDLAAPHLRGEFGGLLTNQRLFRAPIFVLGKFQREIAAGRPIPVQFTKDNQNKLGSGANASVYKVILRASQHNFSHGTGSTKAFSETVAMKVINNSSIAARECKLLGFLADDGISHTNILTSYGGFYRGSETFLFTELADDTLEKILTQSGPGKDGNHDRAWFRAQLCGLADALDKVHNGMSGHTGFHHDIKPANILMVKGPQGDFLKIMDWGCAGAKEHNAPDKPRSAAGSYGSPTKGGPPYNPPECNSSTAVTSRSHDVWSLGCVFLDVAIWCRGGRDHLDKFENKRKKENKRAYHKNSGEGQVGEILDCVKEEVNDLITNEIDKSWARVGTTLAGMIKCDSSSRSTMADVVRDWPK